MMRVGGEEEGEKEIERKREDESAARWRENERK